MTLKDYFKNEFWNDIEKIELFQPNEVILQNPGDFNLHSGVRFFGGSNWENYPNDILNIENKDEFILSLFIVSTIDYFIKNNNERYLEIRQKYNPPKLGWCGYGPHFEHPFKILKIINTEQPDLLKVRFDEIQSLFDVIIEEHKALVSNVFKEIIINNEVSIPERFNDPVYFVFLNQAEVTSWNQYMSSLLSN
jgi:hypothetical protein